MVLTLIFVFFNYYNQANAGFFSFLDKIFTKNENIESKNENAQTIPLLKTNYSLDPNLGKGGGTITIVNQNALLPESGPLGTIADIEEKESKQNQISIYIVKKGDNISQIAKMFDVSVNTILWANDIKKGEDIAVGQTLVILPINGVQYTVKKGDTIKSIAKEFNSDIDEISQFNNIETGLIAGQVIIIPNGEHTTPQYTEKEQPKITKKTNNPSYSGYYLRPITDGVKSQKIHGYNGVDLADSCGTPIMASASGDVIINKNSGWNAGYGKYIVISHPNQTQTLYAHLTQSIVETGWHVVKGQIIGYLGTTGRSTGCHVHFEIRGAKNPF